MNDDQNDLPPELTPPSHQPMRPERKRELRAQLLADAELPRTRSRRRWFAPGLAAAAVLAIVGAGAYAVSERDSAPDSKEPLVPAGTSTTTSSATPSRPATTGLPDVTPTGKGDTVPGETSTTTHAPGLDAPQSCADAVSELANTDAPSLEGASVTASRPGDIGTTALYETKNAWVVCDDFSNGDGGAPTLFAWHSKDTPYRPTAQTLTISQNTIGNVPRDYRYQYVAAGRDFDGVQAISYAFPDGHTEHAVVGQNGLWSMNYQPTDGPLADPNTSVSALAPITVTVTYTQAGGGGTDTFTLDWGTGTCGQTNHGC